MYDARRSMQIAGNADTFVADAGSGIDVASAGMLKVGESTATKVEIADTGVETEVQGTLDCQGATNFGADGAGVDVTFHSGTAGDNMLWDASEEQLVITGTNGQTALNVADGDVVIADNLAVGGVQSTSSGVGAIVAATGLSLVEQGNNVVHKTVFTFTNVTFNVTDAGGGDEGWGTLKLYDFPPGGIVFMGASSDLAITGGTSIGGGSGSGDFAIGTDPSTDESALSSTLGNIIQSTALTEPFVGGAGDANKVASPNSSVFDGTSSAADAYLNMIFDAGDVPGNTTITLNGTITIVWINVGDF